MSDVQPSLAADETDRREYRASADYDWSPPDDSAVSFLTSGATNFRIGESLHGRYTSTVRAAGKGMRRDLSERAYWAQVLQWVRRRTRGREDAEDLLHSAYERLAHYRTEASQPVRNPAAFLVTTASRMAIDDYRRSQIWAHEDLRHAESRADDVPLQDEVVAARARLHRVTEGLAKLSPRTREIFLMHRLDGLKYREIAARLDITESAVEKHIAKAMLFLTAWAEGW